jgi:hypothetical protein
MARLLRRVKRHIKSRAPRWHRYFTITPASSTNYGTSWLCDLFGHPLVVNTMLGRQIEEWHPGWQRLELATWAPILGRRGRRGARLPAYPLMSEYLDIQAMPFMFDSSKTAYTVLLPGDMPVEYFHSSHKPRFAAIEAHLGYIVAVAAAVRGVLPTPIACAVLSYLI